MLEFSRQNSQNCKKLQFEFSTIFGYENSIYQILLKLFWAWKFFFFYDEDIEMKSGIRKSHLFQFSVWAALWPMWPLTRSYGWWLPHTASSPLLVKISLWFQHWLQPWNGFPTVKAPPWAWWWVALEAGRWSSTRSRQPSSISKITMYSIRCTMPYTMMQFLEWKVRSVQHSGWKS